MNLSLPHIKFKQTYLEGIKTVIDSGYLGTKLNFEQIKSDFESYLNGIENFRRGKDIPEGFSPQTEYWLIDADTYIGTVKIKHILGNQYLQKVGGHIGYYIRTDKRAMGYGKNILSLALDKCSELGLKEVLVTCEHDNLASEKIIRGNGGVFEQIIDADDDRRIKRFWFNL